MADNDWDREIVGRPELLNAPASSATDSTAVWSPDATRPMPNPAASSVTSKPTLSNIEPPVPPTPAHPATTRASESGPVMPPSVPNTGWSALGAAPMTPPVQRASQPGQSGFLPPVAPPPLGANIVVAEAAPAKSGPRWGWRAVVSFVAGGLIAAAGFGAAQLRPEQEVVAVPEPTTQRPVITTTIPTNRDTGTIPVVPSDTEEPALFVASTLGPSIVQIETRVGLGSGVTYGDGLIITNNHVIEGATSVRVELADGRLLEGEVIGTDPKTDLAVVSIGPGQGVPVAQLATGQKARVGQIAIAIGSPFDLQQSVTAGIVSAVDRPVPGADGRFVAMIQTDAPINPGNSGGALADRLGRVIGINTSIQTDGVSSANVGVGFAIPIDTAVRIADLLVAGEPIQPGFLGVQGDEPDGGEAGVELTLITEGSAAEGAGLLVGDRVLSLNGAPVTGMPELAGLVLANQAGDTVVLEIIRDGEPIEVSVVLGVNDN